MDSPRDCSYIIFPGQFYLNILLTCVVPIKNYTYIRVLHIFNGTAKKIIIYLYPATWMTYIVIEVNTMKMM